MVWRNLFRRGANNNLAKSFGYVFGEVLELERVALNGKQEYTSQAVAMALKKLHEENPLVKIVVSYADHRQHHIGTIYQATNWIYLGKSITSDTQYYYKGKWTHERTINAKPKEIRDKLKATLPKRENSNKFKYVFVFDKRLRKKYLKLALPYPKDKDLT